MAEETTNSGNININPRNASLGLNMDLTPDQVPQGVLTYALNAAVENFDSNSVNYQNEQGNEFCLKFPDGYVVIGKHFIIEQNRHIFFLTNSTTGDSEIGEMINNDCQYRTIVNAKCLNFDVNHPIHKVVHKINNCSTQIYWTDGKNVRRYLDLDDIPYLPSPLSTTCEPIPTKELDCNAIKVQPNFNIPQLTVTDVITGGDLTAGTYQFAVQYSDAVGNPYTSYYSVTNPTPIANTQLTTANFNYQVGKSIILSISNLDLSGNFTYFNLAVIKTVNAISSVELVGTYFIDAETKEISYTGQNNTQIKLTIDDIFEKYPYYDIAQDVTSVQDILIWDDLSSIDRINFQKIANQITLQWEEWRIPASENYADEYNATNLRGYLRDEVYSFEIVPLSRSGKQFDGFHIPGRGKTTFEKLQPDVPDTNLDFIGEPDYYEGDIGYKPYWKIYNTASVIGTSPKYSTATSYKGPYRYGEFAYWESTDTYPCNTEVWGDLAGQPIRHHKFPDVNISPIFESKIFSNEKSMEIGKEAVFPIGVKIDPQQVRQLIDASDLSAEQKADIIGFKIVRGDRGTNKSIIGKGILRNVNTYEREEQTYYYPNYPYNDLSSDVFLNSTNNAYSQLSDPWLVICQEDGEYRYTDPNTNKESTKSMIKGEIYEFCSLSRPYYLSGKAYIGPANYDVWDASGCNGCKGYYVNWSDPFSSVNEIDTPRREWLSGWSAVFGGCTKVKATVKVDGIVTSECDNPDIYVCGCNTDLDVLTPITQPLGKVDYIEIGLGANKKIIFQSGRRSSLNCKVQSPQKAFTDKYRQVFNSPETSFGNPFLGNVLKLESVIYGAGKAHFVEVKNNAKYKLLSKEAQIDALDSAKAIGNITTDFNALAMFSAYQSYLTIYINGITRKNYAYSYNSLLSYDYSSPVYNDLGIKQRNIDYSQYLIPAVQSVAEEHPINNWYRETSVYIKTKDTLPFPSETNSLNPAGIPLVTDKSRLTIGSSNACATPAKEQYIKSVVYYASMKNIFDNQWGQIYSYNTIDTGYQAIFNTTNSTTIFGGDTFINKFGFKTKLPFFIDNRVNAQDDSDVFYDEIGNIAYPKYWHSSRSILSDYTFDADGKSTTLYNIVSYKAHEFDCPNDPSLVPQGGGAGRTFYDGYFYLFSYGIPYFYCESSYNVDLRQAFNDREGDFFPHVTSGIPDDWVQESFVSIANDNTYFYNPTYSKQNKENFFSHLPADWTGDECLTNYPFRAIYSDQQDQNGDNRVNNWLTYKAISYFDFPQNYGRLISLDGIQNKGVLARFENKSLLYNTMLTVSTSNPQAAYLGNDTLFKAAPPIDFAETDLGWVGSQNKMLLKIPQGQVTIDAKRGQVFLISGNQATDLSAFGSGLNRFFTDHLAFEILRWFPNINIDNNFNGVGVHGVYDSKFDRVIITKLDYIPLNNDIKYDEQTQSFYIESIVNDVVIKNQVYLTDEDMFCNKSWTLSYNLNTRSWISFHTYIPNFYIGESNFFYSGVNDCCSDFDSSVFKLQVGTLQRSATTTTTTTTTSTTTTTTTTAIPLDCTLEGEAFEPSCELEGIAVAEEPTTTTTMCQRPQGLDLYDYFYSGYQLEGGPVVDSSGSFDDACAAIAVTSETDVVEMIGFQINTDFLQVGSTLYVGGGTDCTLVDDGWYYNDEGRFNGFVFEVVGGVIISIIYCDTTTTTTSTTALPTAYCYSVEVNGTCTISWKDATGVDQSQEVTDDTIYICALENSVGAACDEYSGITILGGTSTCTTDDDCAL